MDNQIIFGKEARKKVKEGIDKTANAIRKTLGARGRNVLLITSEGLAHITKDGVTVAKKIKLEDPFEKVGSEMVKEVAFRTVMDCGDSTTTASILFQELVKLGCKFLDDEKTNVNELNRGIIDGKRYVLEHINAKKRPVSGDLDLLKKIATISANNDKELGTIIAKAVNSAGENGTIAVVESVNGETSFTTVDGFKYGRGFLANEFITEKESNLATLENPYILISERPLLQMKPLIPIMSLIIRTNAEKNEQRPLLVIAPEIDQEALALLIGNNKEGKLQICAVQCPGQGMSMEDYTNDLATFVGAMVITEEKNIKIESATIENLGSAKKVQVGPNFTLISKGAGDPDAIETRIKSIKSLIASTNNPTEKEMLNERISSISCSVVTLSVGAGSVTELRPKIDRVDDAIKACRAANEEGYVAGSGSTYNGACFNIPLKPDMVMSIFNNSKTHKPTERPTDYQKGLYCVYMAIQEISKQILDNAGKDAALNSPVPGIRFKDEYGTGYDAKADEICNLIERGIIDPAKALRVALENAVSIATTFLTTDVVSYVK